MSKKIFVFGTPEGGASDIKLFLQEKGFVCYGSTEELNPSLQDAYYEAVNGGHPLMNLTELHIFGSQHGDDDVVVYFDVYKTATLHASGDFMEIMAAAVPEAKFVFAYMEHASNLARILATNRKWIPSYGTCFAKCEFRMKLQINEFQEFASCHPNRCMTFNTKHGDWGKLLEFVKQ